MPSTTDNVRAPEIDFTYTVLIYMSKHRKESQVMRKAVRLHGHMEGRTWKVPQRRSWKQVVL